MKGREISSVVIIGGGPGGYVAAIRAAQLGLQVTLVEKEHLGGVCLNWGCIPTKSLLRNAEVISLLGQGGTFGFTVEGFRADYGAAVERSRKVAARLVKGVAALMKKNSIRVVEGTGRLAGPNRVVVALNDGGETTLEADAVVVATGGRARTIPGVEVDGERVMVARDALEMRDLPGSVVIVGAGAIGVEFAHLWRTYGAEVTLVEMMEHILPLEDEEVTREVERAFRRRKVRILTSARVEGIDATADGVRVRVRREDGEEEVLEAERTLIAIGIRPNSEDLGLEEAGVEMDRGWVVVDERMRTSVPGIWAIGDVTGKLPLAHVASAQGIVAAEDIAGGSPAPLDYGAMPRCTYCHPQVASFGLTEAEARQMGYDVQVGRFPFLANGKALALGERSGFVKLVVDRVSGWLLGAHLVGPEVTELLPELVLARNAELLPEMIARSVHAHPTLSEVLAEAAHAVFGRAIHI
ncbi:MAG TPA: dihydrolipoyl dehydrogenase [Anaerolineales bacterium]|nr:dihydrolipoyl dehydrogenase [Anaerolineae bacterium]HIP87769.1 dihydrolipoyl dehydrogenase [Anaerolineales bacterium]